MAYFLLIESSTSVCSVALAKDGELVDLQESSEGQNHAKLLAEFVNEVLKRQNITSDQLSAVAISEGPGSYTGLRIGVSLAKGICYANQIPLIPVSPLQSMCEQVIVRQAELGIESLENTLLIPMMDARRMEVYTASYDSGNHLIKPVSAEIIDEQSFLADLEKQKVLFFGNGADKCKDVIKHANAAFVSDIHTSAQFMCKLAWKAFQKEQFADLAYFEPFYLKDFIAGKPKKNMLNI
ncbi:tRNA (adenosine(37)-N6)-threonylcarbamoyltransferase complex dimerization subunit type 1 TsaB [Mangrovibacterium diazotrophicum]|uniref:tRNA threonylcarbamoyladenosine biosynthesis protein TsaB n=1 Tax=Mangrovibacterium diazotrophicum TaxID=1261403 RepID=A0A419W8R0_9BACT|nr:tRNA (adenosine(37)-N6)-threonylcarbamoyltransferase complex dimerization subunit type 1 TsaB [Mangrovibacterium diazotrophicum]RKD91858.1 tRNA threonylcarbamoyladenosine biosynthesis protein TsaB [Mangrovibacterium diazotrophicum]